MPSEQRPSVLVSRLWALVGCGENMIRYGKSVMAKRMETADGVLKSPIVTDQRDE